MNTQDNQGNGLIGGGIGAVLGGGLVAAKYELPRDLIGRRMAKTMWNPKTYESEESIKQSFKIYDKLGKSLPAINMLYRLGAPITAALIGSTLTD